MASPLVSSRAAAEEAPGRTRETTSGDHYKDLTETGNRARKVSGTQDKGSVVGT